MCFFVENGEFCLNAKLSMAEPDGPGRGGKTRSACNFLQALDAERTRFELVEP